MPDRWRGCDGRAAGARNENPARGSQVSLTDRGLFPLDLKLNIYSWQTKTKIKTSGVKIPKEPEV